MNLRDLSSEIARHASALHPLTDTNALAVRAVGARLTMDFDNSKLEQEVAELTHSVESLRNKRDDLSRQCAALDHQRLAALKLINDAQRILST